MVALMQPHLPEIEIGDFQNVLSLRDDPYSRLAQPGTRPRLPNTSVVVAVVRCLSPAGRSSTETGQERGGSCLHETRLVANHTRPLGGTPRLFRLWWMVLRWILNLLAIC